MSAPLSTSSLGNAAQLRLGTPQARIGISALDGLGAPPDSFSRALENRMNTPEPAPRKPESAPAAPPRPARTAAVESTREHERPTGNTSAGAAEETGAGKVSSSGTPSTTKERTDTQGGGEGRAAGGNAAGTAQADAPGETADAADSSEAIALPAGHDAKLAALAADAAADKEALPADTAGSPTDTAALAGLPAAIAALLAGRAEAPSTTEETGTDAAALQFATEDGRKSLQNSALLPKADLSATAGGDTATDGNTPPAFLLQGRELAAAVARSANGAGTGDLSADALEALGPTGNQTPGLALAHGTTHLLRQVSTAQATSPQLPVATPAGEPGWAEDVGNQVRWMLGRAESKAELVLTPPNMGKLEVSINLAGDQTTAHFVASSQAARDALERALPQLREALQQAGIMLGDANVSTSGQGRERDGRESGGRGERGESSTVGNAGATSTGVWLKQQQGMVDTFA